MEATIFIPLEGEIEYVFSIDSYLSYKGEPFSSNFLMEDETHLYIENMKVIFSYNSNNYEVSSEDFEVFSDAVGDIMKIGFLKLPQELTPEKTYTVKLEVEPRLASVNEIPGSIHEN